MIPDNHTRVVIRFHEDRDIDTIDPSTCYGDTLSRRHLAFTRENQGIFDDIIIS